MKTKKKNNGIRELEKNFTKQEVEQSIKYEIAKEISKQKKTK